MWPWGTSLTLGSTFTLLWKVSEGKGNSTDFHRVLWKGDKEKVFSRKLLWAFAPPSSFQPLWMARCLRDEIFLLHLLAYCHPLYD